MHSTRWLNRTLILPKKSSQLQTRHHTYPRYVNSLYCPQYMWTRACTNAHNKFHHTHALWFSVWKKVQWWLIPCGWAHKFFPYTVVTVKFLLTQFRGGGNGKCWLHGWGMWHAWQKEMHTQCWTENLQKEKVWKITWKWIILKQGGRFSALH